MPLVNHVPDHTAPARPEASGSAVRGDASPEYELKFRVPLARASFVRSWIESSVPPDRLYPPARVVTVYYDTPGLALLRQKVNSDYLKAKVRVRWYAGLSGQAMGSPVFSECKYRTGSARRKVRVRLEAPSSEVAAWPLDAPAWIGLLTPLAERVALAADLAPVLRLSYLRCRFTDKDGARVTFDSDIRVEQTNRARLSVPAVPGQLPSAVFEYKGRSSDLPAHLAPVVRFGGRKGSFSKYLACYQRVAPSPL